MKLILLLSLLINCLECFSLDNNLSTNYNLKEYSGQVLDTLTKLNLNTVKFIFETSRTKILVSKNNFTINVDFVKNNNVFKIRGLTEFNSILERETTFIDFNFISLLEKSNNYNLNQ
jgi:hypothetical protein